MLQTLLAKVIGTQNERDLKKLVPVVAQINALESTIAPLSDEALRGKTAEFKARVANGESLDSLLPEAFAVVREAGRRQMGMRHYDVQLLAGVALVHGAIVEMQTGEGKTLVGTLPLVAASASQTVTVTDNQGTPVTYLTGFQIPANSTFVYDLQFAKMASGIKWAATNATSVNAQVIGFQ